MTLAAQDRLSRRTSQGKNMIRSTIMRSFWVYILLCNDESYYVGVTDNLELRLAEHKEGIDIHSYTWQRRPIQLVYSSEFGSITEAIGWEKQIKGWSRKKKRALINGDWDRIKVLAKNKKNREKNRT